MALSRLDAAAADGGGGIVIRNDTAALARSRRLLVLAGILASSAVATPAAGADALSGLSALGPASAAFNPLGALLHPVEAAMTNGERMRRGLPPKKPHFRRAAGTLCLVRVCVLFADACRIP